jgi:hypothetical protein
VYPFKFTVDADIFVLLSVCFFLFVKIVIIIVFFCFAVSVLKTLLEPLDPCAKDKRGPIDWNNSSRVSYDPDASDFRKSSYSNSNSNSSSNINNNNNNNNTYLGPTSTGAEKQGPSSGRASGARKGSAQNQSRPRTAY